MDAFAPLFWFDGTRKGRYLSSSNSAVAWYHKSIEHGFINISVRLVLLKILFILLEDIKFLRSLRQIEYFNQADFYIPRDTKLHI